MGSSPRGLLYVREQPFPYLEVHLWNGLRQLIVVIHVVHVAHAMGLGLGRGLGYWWHCCHQFNPFPGLSLPCFSPSMFIFCPPSTPTSSVSLPAPEIGAMATYLCQTLRHTVWCATGNWHGLLYGSLSCNSLLQEACHDWVMRGEFDFQSCSVLFFKKYIFQYDKMIPGKRSFT